MVEVVKVDTTRFDATFNLYMELNIKKAIPDIANKIGYEVGKLCVAKTASVPKDVIKSSLLQPSRVANKMTIAEMVSNKVRVSKGEVALYGSQLREAGLKYANKRARTSKFLPAGFIPGVQAFSQKVKDKSPRSVSGVRIYGQAKGGATVANQTEAIIARASIWNSVIGGIHPWFNAPARNIGKVQSILIKGVQEALNAKEADMVPYVERKLNEQIKKFNQS